MDLTTLLAMFSFSLAMSITPGPVNMMIISSGVNHGFKITVPFISGATIGFTLLLILIGFGLMNIVNHFPFLLFFMEVLGASFIIYMGYKIATSRADITVKNQEKKVPKFYEGFLLQWLNPKAWIACVSGVSMFVSSDTAFLAFVLNLLYCMLCLSILLGSTRSKSNDISKHTYKTKIFQYNHGSNTHNLSKLVNCHEGNVSARCIRKKGTSLNSLRNILFF